MFMVVLRHVNNLSVIYMVILQVFNKCLTHKKVGRSHTDLGFSDAISIPSKFFYFRPPDHVISMECTALNFWCQCTQQKLQSICAVLAFDSQLKKS